MFISKFLSTNEIEMVGNYYNLNTEEISDKFNNRKLHLFESVEHLLQWLIISNEKNASELLDFILDMKIGELRKEGIENVKDAFLNTHPNVYEVNKNRYIYLEN